MNSLLLFSAALPLHTLHALFQQEGERSTVPWGWILLILLLVALVGLWWLLGPGSRKRRRRMADLPKPAAPTRGGSLLSARSAPPSPGSVAQRPAANPPRPTAEIPVAQKETVPPPVAEGAGAPAKEPTPAPDEPIAADPPEPDNLRRIDGIGPKVAEIFAANGIATFAQLADASVERLAEILEAEGLKFMTPDTWPEQAAFAAKGDWDGLQGLQDHLKGGRRVEE